MLVLTRKPNESIVINDDIVVTVLAIECGTVRLGIEAPREIPVHRQEVHSRIQKEMLSVRPERIVAEAITV